ncbi:alanine/ornithine racemase family PLP-dependent enzyme [Maritalea porphyrae]|uniref:alanine/ornithine racemase family PLP-dependent enzyme n=1 Tax=Maritalea porphyrae TaxID=880732 RepID=UPI0022B06EFC|nr:alanine/ornithine racemase family PLP-dependent enzyme [Maritalea porphyrae]MCZ4274086.1 alanine/ornithine racemase family PLP-dependent enzyme [Maritalea porphyrae]
MTAPRLEIDLDKIRHNAQVLVKKLAARDIGVSGVTKAMLGNSLFANTLISAGVKGLADSRVENLQAMRQAGVKAPMTLIRSPMISQAAQIVKSAHISLNTELDTIAELSEAASAQNCVHGVLLMVELGDLREGIMPADLEDMVRKTLRFQNIKLEGIGTNLACQNGVVPDARNMGELSALADAIDATFNAKLQIISGGNSANLTWALGDEAKGRINNLRLGEAILLGCEPLYRQPLDELFTDAFVLFAEVIECKIKPSHPTGAIAQTAFASTKTARNSGLIHQTTLALGQMDTDPTGLSPVRNIKILGSSSDHMVLDTLNEDFPIGSEAAFHLNYSALIHAMASPFVTKQYRSNNIATKRRAH